jgi:hypothetical protein
MAVSTVPRQKSVSKSAKVIIHRLRSYRVENNCPQVVVSIRFGKSLLRGLPRPKPRPRPKPITIPPYPDMPPQKPGDAR